MEYYIDPVVFIVGKTGGENRAVRNLLDLFAEGATIPFIARYRKEKTGNMDEVRIGEIKTLYTQFQELEKRKNAVLDTIREQEKLTPGLEKQIRECQDIRILEENGTNAVLIGETLMRSPDKRRELERLRGRL